VHNHGSSNTGAAAAAALTTDALQALLNQGAGPELICKEVAGIFRVRLTEIALLHLDDKVLRFLYPQELKALGIIPLSSPSIAAHTALSGEPETFNNFAQVKHASVFETVKLGKSSAAEKPVQLAIQKMMSAPVFDEGNRVLGVLQISHKGLDLSSSGPDFTGEDLKQLQAAAKVLSKAPFLQSKK
jgi:GAF domain